MSELVIFLFFPYLLLRQILWPYARLISTIVGKNADFFFTLEKLTQHRLHVCWELPALFICSSLGEENKEQSGKVKIGLVCRQDARRSTRVGSFFF
jgi:hypothetical protein